MNKATSDLIVVVGLGKTGLSCIRFLASQGVSNILVMDSRQNPPGLTDLKKNLSSVKVSLGGFDEKALSEASQIIVSPGVPLSELPLNTSSPRRRGSREIIGDIELFLQNTKAPIIAITGSNGKSTVTSLVGEIIRCSGRKVGVGGNVGVPVLDLLNGEEEKDFYVLELSSFQLETTRSLQAKVATVLNVFPDHMDRYESFSHYLAVKQRIYSGCEIAIINRDEDLIYKDIDLPSKVISFGDGRPQDKNFGIDDGYLVYGDEKILSIDELKIKGHHNVKNVLAALAIGKALDVSFSVMASVLRKFSGLPHRSQWIKKVGGVDWYNDSKATNVGATKAAIEGLGADLDGKITLIMGGLDKGGDFSLLHNVVSRYVKTVVLIGRDKELIEKALRGSGKILNVSSLEEAVKISRDESSVGDAVLFSPACSSFDMFDNFEQRGNTFVELVLLQARHPPV